MHLLFYYIIFYTKFCFKIPHFCLQHFHIPHMILAIQKNITLTLKPFLYKNHQLNL